MVNFEFLEKKPKMIDEEERIRIHEYMIQKRIKIEQEQHYKEAGAYEDLERKRHNLEKLFRDIRYSRERDAQKVKTIPKKKLKKRKKVYRVPPMQCTLGKANI